MKRTGIVLVLAMIAGTLLIAQSTPAPFPAPGFTQAAAQIVKVDGKLALINGIIGIKSGSKTYYVPMLMRLSGFVDGIKEGASVKVEGYEYPLAAAPEYSTVAVTKLTVGGKDYDLSQFAGYGYGPGMGYGRHGGLWGGYRW